MRARAITARRKEARKKIAAMRRMRSPEVEPTSAPAPRGIGRSERRETGL
jgi:hypothetical protein